MAGLSRATQYDTKKLFLEGNGSIWSIKISDCRSATHGLALRII